MTDYTTEEMTMTNKIKILIGDDSAQYGVACASSLRAMGFFVITRPKDGLTIYDAIKNEQPDVTQSSLSERYRTRPIRNRFL